MLIDAYFNGYDGAEKSYRPDSASYWAKKAGVDNRKEGK